MLILSHFHLLDYNRSDGMKKGCTFAVENEKLTMMNKIETPTRLFDIIDCRSALRNRRPCFRYKDTDVTVEAYRRQVDALSHALLLRGLKRGEAVALVSENRPEWNVVDMAVMQAGGVLLPLCVGLSAEEYTECLNNAGVRMLFLEDSSLYDRFRLILPQIEKLEYLLSIEPLPMGTALGTLLVEGRVNANEPELERRRNLVTSDDMCTMVYCGGGISRCLSHRAVLEDVLEQVSTESQRRNAAMGNNALCTLYGRTRNYVCQLAGRTVRYPTPEAVLDQLSVA